ncbi:hypothetical protein B0T18DRAFT_418978 [Schizothecium vesticola]|uniref:C2H2-type domain-containing protein n=1 Tax=Schizothecium vesticola TaxID=314040 RepID=A0AA40JZR6_9PEZI|nr:hypothetical protein B0T18DRAFT_418978 [Schizothecium vesticola]
MPYDPGSEDGGMGQEGYFSSSLGGPRSVSPHHDHERAPLGHTPQQHHHLSDEDQIYDDYEEADLDMISDHHHEYNEDMDVDLVQSNTARHSLNFTTSHASPRPIAHPFPHLQESSRSQTPSSFGHPSSARVAVVLQSSPIKGDYVPIPAGQLDDADDVLITSDLVQKPNRASLLPTQHHQPLDPIPPPFPIPTSTPNPGLQPKKRGRPFGWRPGSGPYSAINGTTPRPRAPKNPGDRKRIGRPPKNPPLSARELYLSLTPHFVRFLCEWPSCPAELHNAATLRQHILIVHGRPAADNTATAAEIPCQWNNCTAAPFPSRAAFAAHVEKAHLLPVLWHAGDGPQNTSALGPPAAPSRRYLFDHATGTVQVTPSVDEVQRRETDDERRARVARVERVHRQYEAETPDEEPYTAREVMAITEALEAKQRRKHMFDDYAVAVMGVKKGRNPEPRYGQEWKGVVTTQGKVDGSE